MFKEQKCREHANLKKFYNVLILYGFIYQHSLDARFLVCFFYTLKGKNLFFNREY